jgi:hypothetical protein
MARIDHLAEAIIKSRKQKRAAPEDPANTERATRQEVGEGSGVLQAGNLPQSPSRVAVADQSQGAQSESAQIARDLTVVPSETPAPAASSTPAAVPRRRTRPSLKV